MDAVTSRPMTRKQAILFFAGAGLLALFAFVSWLYVPHHFVILGFLGLAGCIAGLLILAYPKQGFYFGLYFVYAGLTYYTNVPVPAAVTFLVTAAVALELVRGDSIQVRDPLFLWSLAIFTMFVFQSLLFAWDYGYAFSSIDFFAKSVLLMFLVGQLVRTEKDLDALALVLFAATLSAVFLGAVNVKLGIVNQKAAEVSVLGWQRFSATHLNANRAALYFVAGLPFGVYAVKRFRNVLVRTLLVIGVIAVVLATVMTFSRQTIFPLSAVLLAVLVREARSKWIYGLVVLVVAIGLLMVPDFYWHRISSIGQVFDETGEEWSLAWRVKAFKAAWHMFLKHPFTGVGINNFTVRSGPELYVRIGAHNGYLEILTGVGLFGFIAFIVMLAAAIRGYVRAFRHRWTNAQPRMKDASYYFLLSAIAVLIAIFFEHTHFYRVVWLPIVVGPIAARLADEDGQPAKNPET